MNICRWAAYACLTTFPTVGCSYTQTWAKNIFTARQCLSRFSTKIGPEITGLFTVINIPSVNKTIIILIPSVILIPAVIVIPIFCLLLSPSLLLLFLFLSSLLLGLSFPISLLQLRCYSTMTSDHIICYSTTVVFVKMTGTNEGERRREVWKDTNGVCFILEEETEHFIHQLSGLRRSPSTF
jgi:hypothetical protein